MRGHRRGEQRVERSASPRMEQQAATRLEVSQKRGKIIGKTGNLHQSFPIRAQLLIILYTDK